MNPSSEHNNDTAARERRREEAALSRLPLPRTALPQSTMTGSSAPPPKPPTIRILAVADVDLRSAARLAEYALKDREDIERTELGGMTGRDDLSVGSYEIRTRPLGGGSVDLCIACGPFVHYQSNNEVSSGGKIMTGLAGGDVDSLSSASCSCCSEVGSLPCEDEDDVDHDSDDEDASSNAEEADEGKGEIEGDKNDRDDSGDDDSSSSGSSTSSGAGGYDNTGGFGYREQIGVRASDRAENAHTCHGHRTNRSTPHVPDQPHMCDRHYRRMRYGGGNNDGSSANNRAFVFRPELDASHEGVITSTLAQLENIVCRVLYVPGQGDPPSLFGRKADAEVESAVWSSTKKYDAALSRASQQWPGEVIEKCPEESGSSCGDLATEAELTPHKRLTPNSRNVHRRWIQLGPGLGIAGLARDIGLRPTGLPTTIEFDQSRYAQTLDALLSLAPPSKNAALFSSSLLASRPSQAIVLTNLPGDNERSVIPGKRRGKRVKEDSLRLLHLSAGDSDVVDNSDIGKGNGKECSIPAAYHDLLSMSIGGNNHRDETDESQVLLKLASPPLQSRRRSRRRRVEEANNANQPRVFESDGVKLVMPGSLRKSGDYALIDVALVRDDQSTTATTSRSLRGRGTALGQQPRGRRLSPPSYRWSVDRVQFRSIGV